MCLKEYSSLPAAAAVAQHPPLTHENSSFLPYFFFLLLMNFYYWYNFSEISIINHVIVKGKIMQVSWYTYEVFAGKGKQVQVKVQNLLVKKLLCQQSLHWFYR